MAGSFFRRHLGVGHNNNYVAGLGLAGCSAVEADDAAAGLAGNGVCVESFTIVVIDNPHALPFEYACGSEQIGIDGDASDIVEICLRHLDAVNLGGKHFNKHGGLFWRDFLFSKYS